MRSCTWSVIEKTLSELPSGLCTVLFYQPDSLVPGSIPASIIQPLHLEGPESTLKRSPRATPQGSAKLTAKREAFAAGNGSPQATSGPTPQIDGSFVRDSNCQSHVCLRKGLIRRQHHYY
jgi:hypothetical protein